MARLDSATRPFIIEDELLRHVDAIGNLGPMPLNKLFHHLLTRYEDWGEALLDVERIANVLARWGIELSRLEWEEQEDLVGFKLIVTYLSKTGGHLNVTITRSGSMVQYLPSPSTFKSF